ncbi:MAG: acyl-CoA dehydrogenase family protein [Candidatus Dormibacteraeota bacterium]|nr:acyl-CoA dehydrogenase family protein [Candidatus Dormibacteraeota bacterium]
MPAARLRFRRPLLPDGSDGLRLQVREFLLGQEFEPSPNGWLTGFDPEFSRRLGARGWVGMSWPEHYGGGGRSLLDQHVVAEELLAAGAPLAAHWVSERQVGPLLLRHGSEELKRHFLPAMARGECCFCAGASLGIEARPVTGGYLVTGRQTAVGPAARARYLLALVQTLAGPSQLIVDLGSGLEPDGGEVALREVFVPQAMLLGREGEGLAYLQARLVLERAGPERFLGSFPLLRRLLEVPAADEVVGRLTARLWGLRRLSLSVAGALEAGESPTAEAAALNELTSAFAEAVADAARRHGLTAAGR